MTLQEETLRVIRDHASRGYKTPGCDNWRAVEMCRQIMQLAERALPPEDPSPIYRKVQEYREGKSHWDGVVPRYPNNT